MYVSGGNSHFARERQNIVYSTNCGLFGSGIISDGSTDTIITFILRKIHQLLSHFTPMFLFDLISV